MRCSCSSARLAAKTGACGNLQSLEARRSRPGPASWPCGPADGARCRGGGPTAAMRPSLTRSAASRISPGSESARPRRGAGPRRVSSSAQPVISSDLDKRGYYAANACSGRNGLCQVSWSDYFGRELLEGGWAWCFLRFATRAGPCGGHSRPRSTQQFAPRSRQKSQCGGGPALQS